MSGHSPSTESTESIPDTQTVILEPKKVTLRMTNFNYSSSSSSSSSSNKASDAISNFVWMRIFVLILSIILLLLSTSYCMGQLIDIKLDIITKCEQTRSRDEIWHNSYKTFVQHNESMTEHSQFGWTDDACWSTNKIEINTDELWYYNNYTPQSLGEWKRKINVQCVLFGLISIYLCVVILYNIITLIMDAIHFNKGDLYTKSQMYTQYIEYEKTVKTDKEDSNNGNSWKTKVIASCKNIHWRYLDDDTIGWIMMKFANECIEFVIQTQALLLYNGYNIFDANHESDVYLANKEQFIVTFALILSVNCLGSGVLWLFYGLRSNQCHGLVFNGSIFFVDKFSDLLYTIYPFYVLLMDDYNKNTNNIFVLLGQLRIDSGAGFIAVFMPLSLLCIQCLTKLRSARSKLFDQCFEVWMTGRVSVDNSFITQGNVMVDIVHGRNKKQNWVNKSVSKKRKIMKQSMIVFISLCFMMYGIVTLGFTLNYMRSSIKHCDSVKNVQFTTKLLSENPELYLWDQCLYKTYPFVNDDEYKCQCRVFYVDWNTLNSTTEEHRTQYLNLTQVDILEGALNHWYMLEKFYSSGKDDESSASFPFTQTMYRSRHMKAFEWRNIYISSVANGISEWNELEYLALMNTISMNELPQDLGDLSSMQYLYLENNGLNELPQSICRLTKLQILHIRFEIYITSLPHCISDLTQLDAIWMDITGLSDIPLSIFSLHLTELSLFNAHIDYEHLLEYNNLSSNDSSEIEQWFDDNFVFNTSTQYWLSLNDICNEIDDLPLSFASFINSTCIRGCTDDPSEWQFDFCPPRLLGNGHCDPGCDTCQWDNGDCSQLCFASELTNCTYDKFANNKCDEECDNEYCSKYSFDLEWRLITQKNWTTNQYYTADLHHCPMNGTQNSKEYNFSAQLCVASESIHVDPNLAPHQYYKCKQHWIGNGVCDDSCITYECLDDKDDCDEDNMCKDGTYCYYVKFTWDIAIAPGVYKVNHSVACSDIWPKAEAMTGYSPGDCMSILQQEDYNKDGFMNFREYTVITAYFQQSDLLDWRQFNCSHCAGIGVENYNL